MSSRGNTCGAASTYIFSRLITDSSSTSPMLLRLNMFHLLQAVSPKSVGLDIGVPARGWTGEAYQGHIFWDELFIFPLFDFRMPEITRFASDVPLPAAGRSARGRPPRLGTKGRCSRGRAEVTAEEETQALNLNPRSQRWVPDNSYLQRHVGSAIALNVWQYFQVTDDVEFLDSYGAEIILEIARFWSSIASFDDKRGAKRSVVWWVPTSFMTAIGFSNAWP